MWWKMQNGWSRSRLAAALVLCLCCALMLRRATRQADADALAEERRSRVRVWRHRPTDSSYRRYPIDAPAARRCSWDTGRFAMTADVDSPKALIILSFITFFEEEVLAKLGYLYALRDGNLLGAVRHGGSIPNDGDLDAVLRTSSVSARDFACR